MEDKDAMIKFGKEIRKKRIDCDLSRVSLSNISGVTFNQIRRIEQGKVDPRLATIVKLMKALGEKEFWIKF